MPAHSVKAERACGEPENCTPCSVYPVIRVLSAEDQVRGALAAGSKGSESIEKTPRKPFNRVRPP